MKIQTKETLVESQGVRITKIEIKTPEIAKKAHPGEFVILMVSSEGERIPLTVVNADPSSGILTLIFQEIGLTTKLLGKLNAGDLLYALVGPLGHATEIKKYGKVVLLGGGVGIAEILPVARALKKVGNHVVSILGVRTKQLLFLEQEMKEASDELYITTDDGSYGKKGFVSDVLKELLTKSSYDLVYSVGPIPMMRATATVTKETGTKTMVSLNALMVDGTGMCGCCRVSVGGEVKFSCVDGPEFDAHLVDWKELSMRNNVYCDKEKHICKLKKL